MSFPATLDNFTPHVDGSDDIMAIDVNELQSAIEALEAKMGVDYSEVATTIDYRVAALESGKQDALGFTPENSANKGSANGYASLGSDGKVPSGQLPSYVDDVLEYANFAALPVTGETGKIYVTLDDNKTYRWSGSAYVEISASLALGETSATAYRGDRGKTAYDHSQLVTGNPHAVTKTDVGLGNVTNDAQITKAIGTAAGDIIYFTGNATPARLAKGNDGQFLSLASGLPVWADAAGGGADYFGDGSDGDVTISTNTSLARDMFYNNLTVNNGVTLNPNGYRIFVKGTLTNNGTIARNGNNGSNGNTATTTYQYNPGGAGGTALASGTLFGSYAGGAGGFGQNNSGNGGNGESGAAVNTIAGVSASNGGTGYSSGADTKGTGGAATIEYARLLTGLVFTLNAENIHKEIGYVFGTVSQNILSSAPMAGGGGGGKSGGGGAVGGSGAGAGTSGGVVYIAAAILVNNGTISANGGTGGNGGNGYGGGVGGGGGGAGGNGGLVVLVYETISVVGTISVNGGNAGSGGSGSSGNGSAGTNGSAGKYIRIKIS